MDALTELYIPEYFGVCELVPIELYEMVCPVVGDEYDVTNEHELLKLYDPNILRGADWLRQEYGPMVVNNWYMDGPRNWSGIRFVQSAWYSRGSMHSVGQAIDLQPRIVSPEQIRVDIRKRVKAGEKIPFITRIENGTSSWIHIDTKKKWTGKPYFFNP